HAPASAVRVASRLTGIPWSMGAHAKDIHLSDPASLTKKIGAARFTLVCSAANQELLARLAPRGPAGEAEAEVAVVHHGVDAAFFRPPAGESARHLANAPIPVLLSVGRLVPKKGFDGLLDAARILEERQVPFRLEIVGAGPERERLQQRIQSLGLGSQVALRGMMVREEIRAAYQRAFCFVLGCRVTEDGDRDGIPNTVAEAMASGLPVVSTRLPGVE